ncbi:MAG: zf-HC2 domain-containing protein [Actinomycetota bacterium]|nr:zf-HC2 domain-containing protein [Actinomycetota bacterium]
MPTEELTCQELVEIVTEYLEGAMSREDRLRFEEHLLGCPGCTAYVEQMRETVRLTGALRESDVDPVVLERLLESFQDWKRSPTTPA